MKKELTEGGLFYCLDCESGLYLQIYHGVPILCPECGSTKIEPEDDDDDDEFDA